jgi:hypothetical protein
MKLETKKSAVDLTELAIGIVTLGIIVSIGSVIIVKQRDTHFDELTTARTNNETITASGSATQLSHYWGKSVIAVTNSTPTSGAIDSANYTTAVNDNGAMTITFNAASHYIGNAVNVTYDWYNTSSRIDWTLSNQASAGLGEYGNWFKILVIVGVASVVLALIFMAFGRGRGGMGGSEGGIGGEY